MAGKNNCNQSRTIHEFCIIVYFIPSKEFAVILLRCRTCFTIRRSAICPAAAATCGLLWALREVSAVGDFEGGTGDGDLQPTGDGDLASPDDRDLAVVGNRGVAQDGDGTGRGGKKLSASITFKKITYS